MEWSRITEKLKEKYRLVVLNDASFKEKISFRFTPMSLAVMLVVFMVIMVAVTTVLIAFTSLREYIPGYGSTSQRDQIWALTQKMDSLETMYEQNAEIEKGIRAIVLGEYEMVPEEDTSNMQAVVQDTVMLFTRLDSILMKIKLVNEDKKGSKTEVEKVKPQAKNISYMFSPVVGGISGITSSLGGGVDIACEPKSSVCAVSVGTVVYVNRENHYNVCVIHHPDNMVTVYRTQARMAVMSGQSVKAKQVIAVSDREQTVHFELWVNGVNENPEKYIMF